MLKLWVTTFIWAFSFSLIGKFLAGKVDSYIAIGSRFFLAALVLLPFCLKQKVSTSLKLRMMIIGAIQVGLMYLCFYNSFRYLPVYEVILFTIFTPIYISLIGDLSNLKFNYKSLLVACLAVLGSFVIRYNGAIDENFLIGFLLVQGANISFSLGQILYKNSKELIARENLSDSSVFFYFFFGALIFSIALILLFTNYDNVPRDLSQYLTLLWLGLGASGLGYLLWNSGAKEVSYSQLAVMNNMVIPIGIVVNLFIFSNTKIEMSFYVGTFIILLSLYLSKKFSYEKN